MVNTDKSANITTYEVRVTDPFGTTIRAIDDFKSLYYARKINSVGELSMTIENSSESDINVFVPENRIEVWRSREETPHLDMDAVWFIHTVTSRQDSYGSLILEIEAHDQIGLLERRIIPYNEGNPTTEKQAESDDVIKAIMRENFGALASDTDRDLSTYLTIQADTSIAPQVTIYCAKDNVYDTIKEIADTSYQRAQAFEGFHTGGMGELAVMTDAAASFTVDAMIGWTIYNLTDGSYGIIISNTVTTVTVASLTNGTDNDWDTNDLYELNRSLLIVKNNCTVSAVGDRLGGTQGGSGTNPSQGAPGGSSRNNELILRPNTKYLF